MPKVVILIPGVVVTRAIVLPYVVAAEVVRERVRVCGRIAVFVLVMIWKSMVVIVILGYGLILASFSEEKKT